MPNFSSRSWDKLSTCHPILVVLFQQVIKQFDCTIVCGYRSPESQLKLFEKGATKVKHSRHNEKPSMAVDVAPYYTTRPHIRWDDIARFRFLGGYVIGTYHQLSKWNDYPYNIRWGEDWDRDTILDDQTFNDFVHFELRHKDG